MNRLARLFIILLLLPLLADCSHAQPPSLVRVMERGELRVLNLPSAVAYLPGEEDALGFDQDLARLFADQLGVKITFITPDHPDDIPALLASGEVDLAAGLVITPTREERLKFGPEYDQVRSRLVYRSGAPRPSEKLTGLEEKRLAVRAGSYHEALLEGLQEKQPDLTWISYPVQDSLELLNLTAEERVDYALVDNRLFERAQRYYPQLREGPLVGDPRPKAWALDPHTADDLRQAVADFFKELDGSGQLAQIRDRHYGHLERFDLLETLSFWTRVSQRLGPYRGMFQQASSETGIDWRLLAAIGYQESHWNPDAVSPTGVRGLMMLTEGAAREVGVKDRTDAESSIFGGARYILKVREQIPDRIAEPDRTWMALAAYNVGIGHLEDARVLTQKRGGNPDLWLDVKENLPLLSKERWYKLVRHGYARGNEPVRYVENIRNYYELLMWATKDAPENLDPTRGFPLVAQRDS